MIPRSLFCQLSFHSHYLKIFPVLISRNLPQGGAVPDPLWSLLLPLKAGGAQLSEQDEGHSAPGDRRKGVLPQGAFRVPRRGQLWARSGPIRWACQSCLECLHFLLASTAGQCPKSHPYPFNHEASCCSSHVRKEGCKEGDPGSPLEPTDPPECCNDPKDCGKPTCFGRENATGRLKVSSSGD